jgi:hypothetical protein
LIDAAQEVTPARGLLSVAPEPASGLSHGWRGETQGSPRSSLHFSGPDFCLIFAPCGYDDPEILPTRKPPVVSKALTADNLKDVTLSLEALSRMRFPDALKQKFY